MPFQKGYQAAMPTIPVPSCSKILETAGYSKNGGYCQGWQDCRLLHLLPLRFGCNLLAQFQNLEQQLKAAGISSSRTTSRSQFNSVMG